MESVIIPEIIKFPMADLVISLGLITGLLTGGLIYWSRRRWGITTIGVILVFLVVGTPLPFLILPVAAGVW